VARWAGWGAGPSGAGSVGGPTRTFLVLALLGCAVVTLVLVHEGRLPGAGVALVATVYFAFRLFFGLGKSEG